MAPLRFLVPLCGLVSTVAGARATAKLLWHQSEPTATYTSASVSLQSAGPSFAIASFLNQPEFIEVLNATSPAWSFASGAGTYLVDQARHVESAAAGSVDTFGAVITAAGTTLFGFSASLGAKPAWTLNLPGCNTDGGGGTYIGLEASDDGSLVGFFCPHNNGTGITARVYGVEGQTGKAWKYDLGPGVQAGQGQVQVSTNGEWVLFVNENGVPTPNSATAYVLNGKTGQPRGQDSIPVPFFITAAISDSGNYVVVGDESSVHVWGWAADIGAWSEDATLMPPAVAPGGWTPWDVQMSTGDDAAEIVVVGCISFDVKTVQVAAWGLLSHTLLTSWVSKTNPSFQENPSLRADGTYIAVALWGDNGEASVPTTVLLRAGSNETLIEASSPGSMFAVDVAVDPSASTPSADSVLLVSAGKAVPANEAGYGGDAYAWRITVPK